MIQKNSQSFPRKINTERMRAKTKKKPKTKTKAKAKTKTKTKAQKKRKRKTISKRLVSLNPNFLKKKQIIDLIIIVYLTFIYIEIKLQ